MSDMSETGGVDLSAWLTKREVAARLGVAEKTLERMSKRSEIQQATRKRPGSPGEVVYHPGDVERIAAEMSKPPAPFLMPADAPKTALVKSEPAAAPPPYQLTFAAMAEMLRPADHVRITERLFLTVDEAAEYSGLPKSYIREQIAAGKFGMRTGGGWRIRRADLEKL